MIFSIWSLGMTCSAFYLAFFIGPSLGGILVNIFGFREATVAYFIVICLSLILDSIDVFIAYKDSNYDQFK